MKDSEYLQWLHDRIVYVYNESKNVDFLIKMREIIQEAKTREENFEKYLHYLSNKNK